MAATEEKKKRSRGSKPPLTDGPLTLSWSLAELPSSQHRAGLAGLVLMVRWLERQPDRQGLCRILSLDDRGLTLELDRTGLASLFDLVYAAALEEKFYPQPLKNRAKEVVPPLREEEVEVTDPETKKVKRQKRYYYPVVVPRGAFLADPDFEPTADERGNGLWIKLWRDMIWSIFRGVPATRSPFDARANHEPVTDASDAFDGLQGEAESAVDLPSTYFLGAQAATAENVAFQDRARFFFLLHFWPFVAWIYVPSILNNEGNRDFDGYAVTVPDVASLEDFCDELPQVLRERGTEKLAYLPRGAVVDVAVESALDLLERLRERIQRHQGGKSIASLVLGIDVIHTRKDGNNVRVLGSTRLEPVDEQIDQYVSHRRLYWDPLFRRTWLLNLVEGRPWYTGMDRILCTRAQDQTIQSKTFRHDAREAFKQYEVPMSDTENTPQGPQPLERQVLKIVEGYVYGKLDRKYNLTWDTVKGNPSKEKEYSENKEKIARDAFLAIRARSSKEDFVAYFTGTLCSVRHGMTEADYLQLSRALLEDHEKIRTLTLLALSARG